MTSRSGLGAAGSVHPLVQVRMRRRPPTAARATELLLFPHGGMGDSVVFEAIVRDTRTMRPDARVVAVLPPHADDYDARNYEPGPHEVWMLSSGRLEPFDDLMRRVHAEGVATFAQDGPVETVFLGPPADNPPLVPGCRWVEPYALLDRLSLRGVFPRFSVLDSARALAARTLAACAKDPRAPWVAIHCRTGATDAQKNPRPGDVAAVARELRRDGVGILLLGAREAPSELRAVADATSEGDDPSLQSTAALLEACTVLIGGDSGPLHLAAAVGTRVIAIVAPDGACYGPFAPAGQVTRLPATRDRASPGLHADVDGLLALAQATVRAARGQRRP